MRIIGDFLFMTIAASKCMAVSLMLNKKDFKNIPRGQFGRGGRCGIVESM